ncbi:uncharacterized protein LOC134214945 isoform X2 [Armigeres subalbatus]|uniref:uncharacterized protein LOC134214945 isoform X2 n=1 Tax=Armigeres subalbatus TaxID=124917 RepID=UPI002ED16AAE
MTSSKKLRLDLEESGEPAVHSPESGALFLNEEYLEQLEGTSSDPLSAHIDYDPNLSESQFSDAEQEKNLNEGFSRDKLPAGLYGCWLLVAVRNFKGHSSGKEVGRWGVAGNSVDEFMNSCWKLSHTFLKREVVFTCDESGVAKPSWSEKVSPEEDDFVRFALFNDKSVRDTLMGPGTLDKSGAASNATIDELSAKLRGEHGLHWEAHNVAWMMWANVIAVSEPHVQEGMIYDAPPAHLAKLFRAKEQPRVQSISRNFSMAHSVNDGYQDDISAIKRSFNQLEEMLRGVNKGMQLLKKHIESLESRAVLGDSFLSAAEQAVLVEETGFSSSLARNVTDAEDVDHM